MLITGLTKDNVQEYRDFLTSDIAELIGRNFVSGFALEDEDTNSPLAGIVWEFTQGEDELDTRSRILFIKAKDEESAGNLLEAFTDIATQTGCSDTVFDLAASMGSVEKKALEEAGFSMEEREGQVVSVALADLGMTLLNDKDKADERVIPLSEIDDRELYSALSGLDMEGIRGTCDDMPYLARDYFEDEISCCLEDEEDEELNALVLFHKKPSGKLELILCEALEDATMSAVDLLKQAVMLAEEKYEPSTKILIDCRYGQLQKLINSLFPKAKSTKVIAGYRKEAGPNLDELEAEEEEYEEYEEYEEFDEFEELDLF